jgi:hypothetical protein
MYPYMRSKDMAKMQKIMKSVTRLTEMMGASTRKATPIANRSRQAVLEVAGP